MNCHYSQVTSSNRKNRIYRQWSFVWHQIVGFCIETRLSSEPLVIANDVSKPEVTLITNLLLHFGGNFMVLDWMCIRGEGRYKITLLFQRHHHQWEREANYQCRIQPRFSYFFLYIVQCHPSQQCLLNFLLLVYVQYQRYCQTSSKKVASIFFINQNTLDFKEVHMKKEKGTNGSVTHTQIYQYDRGYSLSGWFVSLTGSGFNQYLMHFINWHSTCVFVH